MTVTSISPQCPACGSADVRTVLEAEDHTVSHEVFSVVQCQACGLRFTAPCPGEDRIGAYYASEDYISHTDTRRGLVNKLYHAVRSLTLQQKRRWVESYTGARTGQLLDIGCGTGAFLQTMRQAGWTVTGLEPDEKARDVARRRYQLAPLPPGELWRLGEGSFQAITLWHVLEHVHDLHGYLEQMHRVLHPQGRLFVALPNYTSLDARIYGPYWAAYDVPRHLYHFSPEAFAGLTARHGFQSVKVAAMPFDAFYISLLSEKYQHGAPRYLSAATRGLRSWMHARRHAESASAVLYILKKQ